MPRGRPGQTRPGATIGPYTAVVATAKKYKLAVVWQFRCECGETVLAVPARLIAEGRRNPLVCTHGRQPVGRQPNNLAGQKCGNLTPIEVARQDRKGEYVWRCQCECGAVTTVRASRLKRGTTTMCVECAAERRKTPDGYRIRDARLKARLTQEQCAGKTGVSKQRVAMWENSIRVRDLDSILASIKATE